jgi:hypothetical protein
MRSLMRRLINTASISRGAAWFPLSPANLLLVNSRVDFSCLEG